MKTLDFFSSLIIIRRFTAWFFCLATSSVVHGLSVSEAGNIVQIRSTEYGNFILIADPGFSELSHYEFSIDLKPDEKPKPPLTGAQEEPNKERKESEEKPDLNLFIAHANALYNQRKYSDALLIVEKLVKAHPDSARALAMRGSLKSMLNDNEGALQDWQAASKLKSIDPKLKQKLETQLPRSQ